MRAPEPELHIDELPDEVLARLEVAAPRYTSYPTVPSWRPGFTEADHVAALERAARSPDEPLSVYVHIPFCREMCTFCGCNALVSRSEARADKYLAAVHREIGMVVPHLGDRRQVSRVHLGGGTPTTLTPTQLRTLWASITGALHVEKDAEIAIEIDPAVTSLDQLAVLRELGFDRVSMGVQDFEPAVQEIANRIQTVEETAKLVEGARALGYRSVSLDIICGLPRQEPEGWGRTLDAIIAMAPDRVAMFAFAYVPQLKPHQRKLPVADMPGVRMRLKLARIARERLAAAGFLSVGFDHFARAHDELAVAEREGRLSRDFQGYTTRRAPDTIAFGVSGISDVGGAFVQSVRGLHEYHEAIAAGRLPTEKGHWRSADDERRREIITSIMCNDVIDLGDQAGAFAAELAAVAADAAAGLAVVDGGTIRLTALGKLFRRNVAVHFDAYLAQARAAGVVHSKAV